jgi:large exoprotein involved in heme utilization and adhesion
MNWSENKGIVFTTAIICGAAVLLHPTLANTNPLGGQVANGQATITNSGNTETINQTTPKALIDWQSFDINPNETTKFVQPSKSSLTVNQINDSKPSSIWGTLFRFPLCHQSMRHLDFDCALGRLRLCFF